MVLRIMEELSPRRPPGKNNRQTYATWNVRSLNAEGKLDHLLAECKRFNIAILGISETHWSKNLDESFETQEFVII